MTRSRRAVDARDQSRDPGDATDSDGRCPDEPTEPPDQSEGAKVQGGEERVRVRVSSIERSHRQDGQVRR